MKKIGTAWDGMKRRFLYRLSGMSAPSFRLTSSDMKHNRCPYCCLVTADTENTRENRINASTRKVQVPGLSFPSDIVLLAKVNFPLHWPYIASFGVKRWGGVSSFEIS